MFQPTLEDPLIESWRWRVFPELSGQGLQCIGKGKNGKMWFGTAKGAWSYDGFQWTCYGTKEGLSGGVDAMCTAPSGIVYASTPWGINCFPGDSWTRLLAFKKQSSPTIKQLVVGRGGTLWAATSWGVLRHKGPDWVLYTDKDGAALLAKNRTFPAIRVEMLPDAILSRTRATGKSANRFDFSAVQEDRNGSIWLGTEAGEVFCLKPSIPSRPFIGVPVGPGN